MTSRLQRIGTHLKEIFTTGNGYYMNEHGETVYGKLPRTKVENPFKTIMRPSIMSMSPDQVVLGMQKADRIDYVYFFVGWMAWTMDGYVSSVITLEYRN